MMAYSARARTGECPTYKRQLSSMPLAPGIRIADSIESGLRPHYSCWQSSRDYSVEKVTYTTMPLGVECN